MQPTVILGSGGHAKVVVELMREAGLYEPIGTVGPCPLANAETVADLPYLGDDADLPSILESGVRWAFVALGNNLLRDALLQRVSELGFLLANAVSRSASISPSAQLGRGLAIMPGAVVGAETRIADGCIVNTNAAVDHDGKLDRCCHLGPGATLAGNVHVGAMAFVATGSSVIPAVSIGENTLIGAGSVVVRDIPARVVAYGVPATIRREFDATSFHNLDGEDQDETPTFRLVS